MTQRCALIMAGGTGGHIFPGLALAQALVQRGWRVHWLGAPDSMEARLVPARQLPLELVAFGGVRGKGLRTLALVPWRLMRAIGNSLQVLRRVRPDVVIGMGGYISFPGGVAAALSRRPLVLHEQNSVAGLANRVLSRVAARVFTAFPHALERGEWIGNPLRSEFLSQRPVEERFAKRHGALRVLVVGGSLGATALNAVVPKALALIPESARPMVLHQAGEKQMETLRTNYAAAGVQATLTPFIDNTAEAFADADLVICRAGASTVTEIAAVGAAAVFVPFPAAVDDHQTTNARFLVDQGAGQLVPQDQLTAQMLADRLQSIQRPELMQWALAAKRLQQIHATARMVDACEALAP